MQDPVQDNRLYVRGVIGEQVIAQKHSMKASVRQCTEKVMLPPGDTFLECLVDNKFVSMN